MKASDWDKIMEFTEPAEAGRRSRMAPPPEQASLRLGLQARAASAKSGPEARAHSWKGAQKTYFKVNSHGKTHRKFYNDLL